MSAGSPSPGSWAPNSARKLLHTCQERADYVPLPSRHRYRQTQETSTCPCCSPFPLEGGRLGWGWTVQLFPMGGYIPVPVFNGSIFNGASSAGLIRPASAQKCCSLRPDHADYKRSCSVEGSCCLGLGGRWALHPHPGLPPKRGKGLPGFSMCTCVDAYVLCGRSLFRNFLDRAPLQVRGARPRP